MAAPRNIKENILSLRGTGKNYDEIANLLGCSKSTVCYHCCDTQKQKSYNRQKSYLKINPLMKKLTHFLETTKTVEKRQSKRINRALDDKLYDFSKRRVKMEPKITLIELKQKIGENPVCYLTGESIDLAQTKTYNFDHIKPRSKGGTNTLDNLGITSKKANMSKNELTFDEYIELCKKVLEYQGYKVTKGA